jgi:hypothetical protein
VVEAQPRTAFNDRLHWFRKRNPKDAWILDELELVGDRRMDVIQSIQNGMACAIRNGSFKDRSGAPAGFVFTRPKTKASYIGCHMVQGPPSANIAYRSEFPGILGIKTLTNLLCLH